MTDQQALDLHPFFRRMTGQVVWALFDEMGVDPADTDAFLELYAAERAAAADLVRRMMDGALDGGFLELVAAPRTVDDPSAPCADCRTLAGRVIPVDANNRMGAVVCLPPFALGCRLSVAEFGAEFGALPGRVGVMTADMRPDRSLECPSGDLFRQPWSQRRSR